MPGKPDIGADTRSEKGRIIMSVYRGVFFFWSDGDPDIIYACRAHRGEFNPDKHVDILLCSKCSFTTRYANELVRILDTRNGNVYYPHPSCRKIQK